MSDLHFEFATATRILFGAGTVREMGPAARSFGGRALVVTGKNQQRAAPLLALLRQQGVASTLFSARGEPEVETVRAGTAIARRERCDLVIGFGGGSALDCGKAIAALLANDGDVLDYLEIVGRGKALIHAPVPFIAIPTTAGTGSEVTRNAVLAFHEPRIGTNREWTRMDANRFLSMNLAGPVPPSGASPERRIKVSLRSPLMLPRLALVDPELTLDLPPAVTAWTGLDALTQLIEPYVCSRANPITDALCVEGMRRVAHSLRKAFEKGSDRAAREDMAVASLLSGMALANAGLGAAHGFAGPIGGMFSAPHGALCAALLPHVMETNLDALRRRRPDSAALRRYDEVARLLTGRSEAVANDGVAWVRQLVADLRIPRLGSYGITREHTPELIQKAANASSMKANPISLTSDELAGILERALSG
jgi:alcohol dehydrogenase class IV